MKSNVISEKQNTKKATKGKEKENDLPSFKTSIECDADDSSDEEEIESLREKYKFERQYGEDKDKLPKYIKDVDPCFLSYTSLALGVELLYSKKVNDIYYRKKRELLSGSKIKSKVDTEVAEILDAFMRQLFKVQCAGYDVEELFDKYINSTLEVGPKTVEFFSTNIRYVFKQAKKPHIIPQLSESISQLKESIKIFINNLKEGDITQYLPPAFNLQQMAYDSGIQNAILGEYLSKVIDWLREKELLDHQDKTISNDKKLEGNSLSEKIKELKKNASEYEKMILSSFEDKKGGSLARNCLNYKELPLTKQKLADLLEIEARKENPVIKKLDTNKYQITRRDFTGSSLEDLYKAAPAFFNRYGPYKLENLQAELLEKVEEKLEDIFIGQVKAITKEIKIKRKVLSDSFQFCSSNFTEFLANLRLSNRSQVRCIRNAEGLESELSRSPTVHRSWKFGENQEVALERQSITYNTKTHIFSRSDIVENLGNYADVNTFINEMIKAIKKDKRNQVINNEAYDRLIAQAVQSTLQCQDIKKVEIQPNAMTFSLKQNVRKVIIHLTYLIFGCEVVRNPSSMITGLMLLDLISCGELTWKDAFASKDKVDKFGGGMMPMSMGKYLYTTAQGKKEDSGEPVPCARKLQQVYCSYLLVSYLYPGEGKKDSTKGVPKIQELVKREVEIVNKWINMVNATKETVAEQQSVTTSAEGLPGNNAITISWVSKVLGDTKERINHLSAI